MRVQKSQTFNENTGGLIMEKKILSVYGYKSIDRENYTVEVVVSDETVDRDGEIIKVDGWDFKNFQKNPVLLDSHNYVGISNIIGKVLSLRTEGNKLLATLKYFVNEGNFLADYAWKLVENGLASYSVGFLPLENKQGNVWPKVELLEISQVTVPANPNAVLEQDAITEAMIKAYNEIKTVVGYSKADWMPDNTKWDANRARRDALKYAGGKDNFDPKKYKEFFLWYDKSKRDNITAYKLPFRYLDNGKPKNVWRGIVAAMATVLGARGGVDIPENERKQVYNVLVKYYKEHGNEPPPYKAFNNELEIFKACGYKSIDEIIRDFNLMPQQKEQGTERGKSLDLDKLLEGIREDLKTLKGGL